MTRIIQTFTVPMSLQFLEGQTQFWQQNGYEMHVLTADSEELTNFGRQNNVSVSPVSFCRNNRLSANDFKSYSQLRNCFRKIKPHIVHANTLKAAFLTLLAAKKENVPICIYEMHGLTLETAGPGRKQTLFMAEKICCHLATHVIAVSPSLRQVVINKKLVAPSKISVMNNGSCNGVDAMKKFNPPDIDADEVNILKNRYAILPDQTIVGFAGRLTKDKGIIELYQAWQEVKQQFSKVRLLIMGEVDQRVPLPKEWLVKIADDKTIIRTGEVKNMASHLALIDFMVLPSYREGLGNVVLEAAAMEKPAIVSQVTGLKDSILKNHTGIFCQPYSINDLTEKIIYYLNNTSTVRKHGIAARARVIEHFAPGDVWNDKLQLYQRLVATRESVLLQNELSKIF
ncbi:glycosyltransferase [Runella sp.]|uniref:glycosyltransferase n=1 Tax=Runella sp. TaxID=1960881 RepID=UPI003D12A5EF